MTDKMDMSISKKERGPGFFRNLSSQLKLVLRLIADRRVNILFKALPLFTLIYLVLPDFLPGPVDDAVVITLGFYTFVELCPEEVVKEHRAALAAASARSAEAQASKDADG